MSSMTRITAIVLMLVMVLAAVPGFAATFDNSTTFPDGTYTANSVDGSTERVTVSCLGITVSNGKATAQMQFGSKSITQVTIEEDDTVYDTVIDTQEKTATVTIPVKLNEQFTVNATTTAMGGDPKIVHYNITLHVTDPSASEEDADYSAVDAAIASVPADLSKYTEESAKAVTDAVAAVVRGKKASEQSEVDAMAKAINDAVAALVEKTAEPDPQPGTDEITNELNSGVEVTLDPGTYVPVDSEKITEGNKMFRCIKATLVVKEDGSAVLDMYLSGTGYNAIYIGDKLLHMPNGAVSKENTDHLWTSEEVKVSEAVAGQASINPENNKPNYHFEVPFEKLYTWVLVAGHSETYDQWSHKKLNFSADNFVRQYNFIEGAGAEWDEKKAGDLVFKADGDFDKFTGLNINGKTVDPKHYKAEAGSTVITLSGEYIATLSGGEQTITALFEDGFAEASFSVKKVAPNTGDPVTNYWIMLVLSFSMLVSMYYISKERYE